eukprot:CCRYP_001554-RA/>CCRYP_001554-RA protein AED:0.34 eAED:0.38 QI:0/0.33/0.5/0.75/0.66/0.5/4/239/244
MKFTAFALLTITAVVEAGTNKTLAPTPGVLRPTPVPSPGGGLSVIPTPGGGSVFPTPGGITPAPAPTIGTPAPVPTGTSEPTYIFTTPAPQPTPTEPTTGKPAPYSPPSPYMSMDYYGVVEHFGYKPSYGSSGEHSGYGEGSYSGGSSGKSGKGSAGNQARDPPASQARDLRANQARDRVASMAWDGQEAAAESQLMMDKDMAMVTATNMSGEISEWDPLKKGYNDPLTFSAHIFGAAFLSLMS